MTTCLVGKPRRRRGSRSDLFRVRDPGRGVATCGGWSSLLGELGSCLPGGDRCCPLRSGRSWPGCGPAVAPAVPSLEGASGPILLAWCHADAAGQTHLRSTAVDRERPPDAGATGTRRARPARTNLAQAWLRWLPSSGDGRGPSPDDHPARWLARRRQPHMCAGSFPMDKGQSRRWFLRAACVSGLPESYSSTVQGLGAVPRSTLC